MFDWIGDLIDSVVGAIQDGFEWIGEVLLGQIWNTMMQWLYETVYTAVADFFALMGNMGADIFNLSWVQATVELLTLFGCFLGFFDRFCKCFCLGYSLKMKLS